MGLQGKARPETVLERKLREQRKPAQKLYIVEKTKEMTYVKASRILTDYDEKSLEYAPTYATKQKT